MVHRVQLLDGMRTTQLVVVALVVCGLGVPAFADGPAVAALDRRSAVSVGLATYVIDGYLTSTPAVLVSPELTYDRQLSTTFGLRGRAGFNSGGIDEIVGTSYHLEVGGVVRHRASRAISLEAAMMLGAYSGGLSHKMIWKDEAGPTAALEGTLRFGLGSRAMLAFTGGYRVARTPNVQIARPEFFENVFAGPIIRIDVGVAF